ncbi:branched-chain amino acid ABC transporter substrate-binding protein [Desulfosarcina widdelii]|uniref:Branched-chain amino acid ABC transporter substrate-binding protein n=1 Tax=Desulfosarcina widdelii TaxID=947919 RepID=A0A5K7ZF07_9BACT|nr:ABC transporter substrate-binding protein [Desulfosarcina widdelii]BBO76984.1 branched-chain amino acid ABC transporter substrate-binding protein [Desulfosarcina widdelii]
MKTKHVAGLLALILFFTVSPVWAADTIKLAVMEPLSGTFKDIGDRYLEGVQYAAEVLNANGGINGQQVEVIPVDSELKPAIATTKATKLILTKGVKYFCGGTGSSVAGAMEVLAQKHSLIFYTYGMAAASLTGEKCSPNFFRVCANTDTHSAALATWVASKGFKKVACIAQDYSFGKEATAGFVNKLKELNPDAEVVAQILHPIGTKDFAPYVSQIINSGAEVVFTSNWGSDLTLLLKQAKPLGLKAKFACYYLNDDYAITAVSNDEAVIGSVGAEVYMLTIPGTANEKFIEGFKKSKGYYPTWLRGKAYLATMMWAEAVKKAGSVDVDAVRTAWEGLSYDGLAGTWTMRACDHQVQQPVWTAEVVAKNPFFKHAYVGPATMVAPEKINVPCEATGCKGLAK